MTAPVAHPGDGAAARVVDRDAALAGLADRARCLLRADSAVILQVDGSDTRLQWIATSGIGEDTVASAIRVPFGAGFAGQIALSRQPLSLADVTPLNVLNPALHQRGVRSLLGVPVLARDHALLGALHVGYVVPRTFDDDEVRLLQGVAVELAGLLLDHLPEEEHSAALVLQRSLLPDALIEVPGLDLAARYVPAEGDLGGDWYDVFTLPGGRVGMVMGDVMGHGLVPAVVMGRLRSALRAYALDHEDPAVVLEHLDRKLSHFEPDFLATVLFAVADPPFDALTLSCAGHPRPLIAAPGRATEELAVDHDLVLGVAPATRRTSTTIAWTPGSTIAFYTDGLVERRPSPGPGADDSALRSRAALCGLRASEPADVACSRLLFRALAGRQNEDDLAVLVMRRTTDG